MVSKISPHKHYSFLEIKHDRQSNEEEYRELGAHNFETWKVSGYYVLIHVKYSQRLKIGPRGRRG